VLATADGHGTFAIMRRTGMSKPTVWRWQERYIDEGAAGLKRDKTRPSRIPPLPMETKLKVIAKTVQETPPNATHWSRALMAEAMGISPSSVGHIWAEAGLKPHLTKGRAATTTHDYKRHGTTTLFAALDVKSGKVIGDCMPRPRAKEFLKFLRQIDKAVPAQRDVHLVLDNYATHKTPDVKAWLAKHPRFKLHFTPTSASWLNLVERFFAEITSRPRSSDIWRSTTRSPNPSGGPKPLGTFSPGNAEHSTHSMKSGETGRKRQTQNTSEGRYRRRFLPRQPFNVL
jgi:transposase